MAKKKEYTAEQQKAINGYGDLIKKDEKMSTSIRRSVGMYIGSKNSRGYMNMNREIFQNAIDQIIMISGIGSKVIVSYSEKDKTTIITDDGYGIPWDKIVDIFTTPHTSKNYIKKPFDFSAGLNGSGGGIVCALSEFFIVESFILGKGKMARFEKGDFVYDDLKEIKNPEQSQGTKITFKVDESVMGDCDLPWEILYDLFTSIISLTPIGTSMVFNCIPKSGQPTSTVFLNEDGLLHILVKKTETTSIKPIMISRVDPSPEGKMTIDILLTYNFSDPTDEDITTFANYSHVIGGTHIDAFLDGLCKFFRDYMNKIFLSNGNKKNTLTIINSDIKTGLKAAVHCKHLYPDLKGQSKEELNNLDVIPFIKQAVLEQLADWAKTNPSDLQKLCGFFKKVAEERLKAEKGKENIKNSYSAKSIVDLPAKYKKPEAKMKKGVKFELWIVEGDSAGGSAANGRNPYQAILPIKGKSPNAFSTTREKFLNNEEVKAYYGILGVAPNTKYFDADKVAETWEKIIIGADGDVDGLHITTLELQKNLLYSRSLIERGMLYRAVPPLFGVNNGTEKKPKMVYYTDDADYLKYIQSLFTKSNDIKNINGSDVHPKELEYIIATNINYIYELERLADTYSIDYYLLEDIAFSSNENFNKLYKSIKGKYKYLDIEQKNGVSILRGEVGNNINTVYLNDRFMNELEAVRKIIRKNQFTNFKVNGNVISLYQFMILFKSYMKKVERYKGLGEMNKDQLAESTLLPDKRTLVRYTVASAKEEIERIRYLESNKYELIQGQTMSRTSI